MVLFAPAMVFLMTFTFAKVARTAAPTVAAAPPRQCEIRLPTWCILQGAHEITDRLVVRQNHDRVWIIRGFHHPAHPLVVLEPNGCRSGESDMAAATRHESNFAWEGKTWKRMTVRLKADGSCDLDILLPKPGDAAAAEAYFSNLSLLRSCTAASCNGANFHDLAARWDDEYRGSRK